MKERLSEEQKTLLMINGYIENSEKTGFASVPTHALSVMKVRYTKLAMQLTEKDATIKELTEKLMAIDKVWRHGSLDDMDKVLHIIFVLGEGDKE